MDRRPFNTLLQHIRAFLSATSTDEEADGHLLDRFVKQRDEAAFEAILKRHGPMVMSVCRRILPEVHDAEDAFQATFLILIRKAHSVAKSKSIGSWLYGVAYRVAVRAKTHAKKRRTQDIQGDAPSATAEVDSLGWQELRPVLDEELSQLPEKYQAPMVLCYFEGMTNEEAAAHLGWPVGTVHGRLARARALLRDRLVRRGITLTGAALAALTGPPMASAALAAPVLHKSLKAALSWAMGKTAAEALSPVAVSLAEGVLFTMQATRIKIILALLLVLVSAIGVGAGAWINAPAPVAPPDEPPLVTLKEKDAKPDRKEPFGDFFGDPLPPNAMARLGSLRLRHAGQVMGVAFSPDGKTVASAGYDGIVRLWDAGSGKELHAFRGDAEYVNAVAFSSDGKSLYAASGSVQVWNVETRKEMRRIGENHHASALAVSTDGKTLATGTGRGLHLWDIATGKEIAKLFDTQGGITAVAFTPDGKFLASGGDNIVRFWDLATKKDVRQFAGDGGGYRMRMAFSRDGKLLATTSDEGVSRLWAVQTGNEIARFKCDRNFGGAAFSPDDKTFVLTEADGSFRLRDATTRKEVLKLEGSRGLLFGPVFSEDGKTLAGADSNQMVRLWDVVTGKDLCPSRGHDMGVTSVAVTPDGKTVVTASYDQTVQIWEAATGKEIRTLARIDGIITSTAVSPDGKLLAVASQRDKRIRLWDTGTWKERESSLSHPGGVWSLSFSKDSNLLASAGRDKTARIWDIATSKEVCSFKGHAREVRAVAFAPDGKTVASAGGPRAEICFWSALTGKEQARFGNHAVGVESLCFSPDGKVLASAPTSSNIPDSQVADKEDAIRLWEVATRKELHRLPDQGGRPLSIPLRHRIVFSADGKTLLAGSHEHSIRVWDVGTGKERSQPLKGHRDVVATLAISADGRLLVSGSHDSTVLVWDLARILKAD